MFAFGAGTHTLIRSTDEGAKWTALSLPLAHEASKTKGKKIKASPGVAIRSIAFTSPQAGFLLDTQGQLWSTHNGGRSWTEVLSQGTGEGIQLAFSDAAHGFMSVKEFGGTLEMPTSCGPPTGAAPGIPRRFPPGPSRATDSLRAAPSRLPRS